MGCSIADLKELELTHAEVDDALCKRDLFFTFRAKQRPIVYEYDTIPTGTAAIATVSMKDEKAGTSKADIVSTTRCLLKDALVEEIRFIGSSYAFARNSGMICPSMRLRTPEIEVGSKFSVFSRRQRKIEVIIVEQKSFTNK